MDLIQSDNGGYNQQMKNDRDRNNLEEFSAPSGSEKGRIFLRIFMGHRYLSSGRVKKPSLVTPAFCTSETTFITLP